MRWVSVDEVTTLGLVLLRDGTPPEVLALPFDVTWSDEEMAWLEVEEGKQRLVRYRCSDRQRRTLYEITAQGELR